MEKMTNKPEVKKETVGNGTGFQKVTVTSVQLEDHFDGNALYGKTADKALVCVQAGLKSNDR